MGAYHSPSSADIDSTTQVLIDYQGSTFTTLVDVIDNTGVTYIGKAIPGSTEVMEVWQIRRITTVGLDLTIEFAALGAFAARWDNRTMLNYS